MDDKQYGEFPEVRVSSHAVYDEPTPTVHTQYHTLTPSTTWRRGALRRFPWLGFLALVAALLSIVGMAIVLAVSNDQAVVAWSVSPAVYLAILSTLANILLAFSLSEGTAVAWWVKAMKPGSRVADLHNIWAFGTSIKSALLSGRSFNLVALACITVAIAPLNGPLLQRASTISTIEVGTDGPLSILAAQEFPEGYTGTVNGHGYQVGFVTSNFSAVVQDYVLKRSINLTDTGCKGLCFAPLQAAGYAIDCSRSTIPFNLSSSLGVSDDPAISGPVLNGTNIFSTDFTFIQQMTESGNGTASLNYTSVYKTNGQCDGDLAVTQCSLMPALIEYRVMLVNDTISLDPRYSYKEDIVIKDTPSQAVFSGPTAHGGMYLALNSMFSSSVLQRLSGAWGWDVMSNGTAALQYALAGLAVADDFGCPTYWSDPTDDMMSTARELAFRTALHAAANSTNSTNHLTPTADINRTVIVYKSHYLYLALAAFFTLLSMGCIIPIFLGWWNLGRKISLSPIEIAKAFDAPLLSNLHDSNLDARHLLIDAGNRPVMYGVLDEKIPAHHEVFADGVAEKLAMGVPDKVQEAVEGRCYSGF